MIGMSDSSQSLLDNIRSSNGSEGLKNYYHDLLRSNRKKALEMINDPKLQFGILFLLRHELLKASATGELNPLYRNVLRIVEMLAAGKNMQAERVIHSGGNDSVTAIRWIVKTGYIESDSGNDLEYYEQLMEKSAALLTKSFRVTAALPELAEMIFLRNRSGRLIHELVWAFFEARSPESLLLLAQRLVSTDIRDAELARRLLCFIPDVEKTSMLSGSALYSRVINWLQENKPFLYYTGESLHLCNLPVHYAISSAAKYLCHPVSVDHGDPLPALNEFESELSSQFGRLPEQQQQQLANFSHMLCRRNIYQWNAWIQLPLHQQINLALHAASGQGGLS